MKFIILARFPKWYIIFAAGVFFTIAVLSNSVNLLMSQPSGQHSKLEPIFRGNLAKQQVAFGCNVFWGEEFLPAMLDTLDKYRVKVTFFIGGSWAKKHPELLQQLVERGHEIANHSYSHPHPNTLNITQNKEEIMRTEELIRSLTGQKTRLYAPPYGEYNEIVLKAAAELDYKTIMWTIDTIDWKRPSPEVIINRVLKKVDNGAIILIHPTDSTAKAFPILLSEIQKRGYIIVPISDIL